MNTNSSLAASGHDDLVIEEFGRYLATAQAPQVCLGSHIAPGPLAAADLA
ncbi:hypothetical protein AB0N93_12695 [Streptomyces sp. NPDC091267]